MPDVKKRLSELEGWIRIKKTKKKYKSVEYADEAFESEGKLHGKRIPRGGTGVPVFEKDPA